MKDEEVARKHLVDAYRSTRMAVRFAGDLDVMAKMNEVTRLLLELIHAYRFGAGGVGDILDRMPATDSFHDGGDE